MKKLFNIIFCLLSLCGCTSEFEESSNNKYTQTYALKMEASLMSFDDENPSAPQTRSGENSLTWADGDRIYLFFEVGNTIVPGIATFSAAEDQWTLEYSGTLSVAENANVQTYYIRNAANYSSTRALLNEQSCVYMDSNGKYSFLADGEVRIMSSLSPTTGRIRFKGTPGQTFILSGITTNNSFDLGNAILQTTTKDIKTSIGDNGFTPYIYGTKSNSSVFQIKTDFDVFASTIPSNILTEGKSGWMNFPSVESHDGWTFFQIDSDGFLPSTASKLYLYIDSREEWTVSVRNNSPWILIDKKSGLGDAKIEINLLDNASLNSRTDYIIVTSVNGLSSEFKLSQEGKHLYIQTEKIYFDYNELNSLPIRIYTDGEYSVESNANWVNIINKTNDSFQINLTTNQETTNKEAEVTVKLLLDGGQTFSKIISIIQAAYCHGFRNEYEFVDLGLPSGKKWATKDVGASTIYNFGDLFAWGETESKNSFTKDNYTVQGYNYSNAILSNSDDAAYTQWGYNWCMPSYKDFRELGLNCTWSNEYVNGHYLLKGTGPNNCYIYFPLRNFTLNGYSEYWTNKGTSNDFRKALNVMASGYFGWPVTYEDTSKSGYYRYYGAYVRPVVKE